MTSREVREKMKEAEAQVQQAILEYRTKMDALVEKAEHQKIERLKRELQQ